MSTLHNLSTHLPDGEIWTGDLLIAFYDITGYATFAHGRPPADVLRLCADYFLLTGGIIEAAGGLLVKTIGDAGLVAFDDVDAGVLALRQVQRQGDPWLHEQGWNGRAIVKAHHGPVALGRVGAPGRLQIDVYGEAVNTAALIPARKHGFAMSARTFRKLQPGTRQAFKKHTPPITYIPVEARH